MGRPAEAIQCEARHLFGDAGPASLAMPIAPPVVHAASRSPDPPAAASTWSAASLSAAISRASSTPRRFSTVIRQPAALGGPGGPGPRPDGRPALQAGLGLPLPFHLDPLHLGHGAGVVEPLRHDLLGHRPLVVCKLQLGDLVGGRRLDRPFVDPLGDVAGVIAKAEHLDAQNARLFAAVQNLAGRAIRGAIQQHKGK